MTAQTLKTADKTPRRVGSALKWVAGTGMAVAALGLTAYAQVAGDNNRGADFSPKAPILAKSGDEEAKTFVMPTGYRMELVLSDPDVVAPAIIEFDGNGRMYVAEFETYMHNVDGNGQRDPLNQHQPLGGHERRRQVRQAHRLRRQAGPAAHDSAARQGQHPHQRDRLG